MAVSIHDEWHFYPQHDYPGISFYRILSLSTGNLGLQLYSLYPWALKLYSTSYHSVDYFSGYAYELNCWTFAFPFLYLVLSESIDELDRIYDFNYY
ncbi:hypothetical protein EV356DRAFT_510335 [Viridothelium virens]|uniref:Uncharacterized protein n=1 Tax=Viridothelium virens TaxID=1048519 RepID=A0A6A6GWH8_VIRVR|nr:hypothetical protein EV356DRAFT_510335 [Viridothelium virens]